MSQSNAPQFNRNSAGHKPSAPRRPAILHITTDLELRAQSREIVDLAIQTHRAGWTPLIASAGGSLVVEAERTAVRHTKAPLNSQNIISKWNSLRRIEKLIDKEKPILLHAHGIDVTDVAVKLARKKGLPLVVDLTEPVAPTPRHTKRLQAAAAIGAYFRVPSAYMVQHLQNDLHFSYDHIYQIAPGIDLQWYDAARVTPERINQLYRWWRLPEQSTVIVMATPFGQGYGHKLLIEAMAELKTTDIYAVMIGDDKTNATLRNDIEQMIAQNGLEGRVVMPENCTDWPAACWIASLIVAVNSVPRGQGQELLAAQAVGRPVIVTQCGANAEMVKPNETAWLIPVDDKENLSKALREALSMSPSHRIDLAMTTRDFVAERFPMELWRDSLFSLYETMLTHPTLAAAA